MNVVNSWSWFYRSNSYLIFRSGFIFSSFKSRNDRSKSCMHPWLIFVYSRIICLTTHALINLISDHVLHAVDKVSALFLPNDACHTAYCSHKCCLPSLFRLTFIRFHLFIIYLPLPLPGIFCFLDYFYIFLQCYSYFSPSFYNDTPTLILLASYYFLFPSVRLLFDSGVPKPSHRCLTFQWTLEWNFIYCLLQFDLLFFLLSVLSMLSMLPMLFMLLMLLMLCVVYFGF